MQDAGSRVEELHLPEVFAGRVGRAMARCMATAAARRIRCAHRVEERQEGGRAVAPARRQRRAWRLQKLRVRIGVEG